MAEENIKNADYLVFINNDGLVAFQVQESPIYTNPDLVDINEEEHQIIFKTNNQYLCFPDLTIEVQNAIIKDNGFDVYESDSNAEPVKFHRYGEPHKPMPINPIKNKI